MAVCRWNIALTDQIPGKGPFTRPRVLVGLVSAIALVVASLSCGDRRADDEQKKPVAAGVSTALAEQSTPTPLPSPISIPTDQYVVILAAVEDWVNSGVSTISADVGARLAVQLPGSRTVATQVIKSGISSQLRWSVVSARFLGSSGTSAVVDFVLPLEYDPPFVGSYVARFSYSVLVSDDKVVTAYLSLGSISLNEGQR